MCTNLTYVNIRSSEHYIDHNIVKCPPPQDGHVKLNIGGSCGASSDVGFGGLLRDNKGYWIVGFSFNEGHVIHFLLSSLVFNMV
jgi:hypothetical protein